MPKLARNAQVTKPGCVTRFVVTLVFFLLWLSPSRLRLSLSRALAPGLLACRGKRRHIIQTNLRYCFPGRSSQEREQLALAYAQCWAFSVLDMGRLWFTSPAGLGRYIRVEGNEYLENAMASGRPVLLLAPHTVGLEHAALCLATRYPMLGLTREDGGDLGSWILQRLRARRADLVFDRTTPMRKVITAIRSGRALYYLPDEDHDGRRRCVFVPYFGRKVSTLLGSGRLIALCDAQLLPCMTRLDTATGVYTVTIEKPLAVEKLSPEATCALIRQELERMIRAAPENYLWNLKMFQSLEQGGRNPDYAWCASKTEQSGLLARLKWRKRSA